MGRFGGWGAADAVFAPGASGNDLRDRERLRAVLTRLGGSGEAGERLFRSAGLTVLNAHYTDPMLVGAIYQALAKLGLDQGTVVEPGAGSGQFAAFAPAGIRITGVELDQATALIAQLLHPDAEILAGSVSDPRFARVRDQSAAPVRVPRDTADGFVGNVPFSDVKWPDEVLNPGTRFSLHDHAIRWGVTRVAPGGLCAFITSRYTADAVNPRFRRTLAGELDLIGMVRLPSTAHKRMAGTGVVTDIIIGRRIADGERPLTSPESWEQSRPLAIPGSSQAARVNTYFHDNPRHILGTLQAGGMYRAGDFTVAPSGDLEQQLGAALGEIAGRALAAGQRHEPRPAARPVIEILSRRPDGTITAKRDGTFTQVVHGQDVPLVISSDREADQTRKLVALAEARSTLIRAEASCPEDTDEIDAMRSRMGELYDAYTAAYGPIGRFTTRTVTYHVKTLEGVLDRLDFSRKDVPDPEVKLLEAYLGRGALTRIVRSAADPGQVRHSTRKDKHGETVTVATQLVETARVRAALTAALAQIPQGADAEALTATFSERMSRIEKGEQRTRLMPAAFRSDPRRPAVEALETFDPVTQTAVKKPVFSRRTAVPHRMELGADTPQEALDLVLIHRRRVDLGEIARLLGTDEADARAQLGTLVFDDPAAGDLVAAGEYLSGNVREKLAAARTAADGDPERYTANVESLQAVQPPALAAEDIQARLGSAWLSREIVQEGLRYVLEDPRLTVIHPGGSEWKVESRTARNSRAQDTYGTSDWNALDLAGALLTNASITVRRTTIDPVTGAEKSYRDDAATLFAFRKAQRLDADFVSWLWSDPDRADECVRLYNSAYNNQVKRVWDASPFYIPGLAPGMKLHPFQNAMVRRLHTESGMAAWVVGSGKTELGITAAMEGARLGRHRLTAIVTPASLVNQWRDRIYRTFPEARVLVADDDLRGRKDSREVFAERAASGDYQVAITPYEFFGSLPLSADAARASVDEEIDKLTRYAQEATAQGDRYTAKDLQGKIAKLEAKYSAAVKASGGAAGFTDTGIDSVVVDEWHNFRRIRRDSNNRLLAMPGSGRANHMLAVFDYLRKHHPEGLRLGLSGTPLEQSIADAWAAMRFFTPERLKELGLEEFDAFLTTFGRTEPRREPTPTGSGLHVRERQADWFNLPDMRRTLWDPFADVVRRADLGLNLPRLAGGRPQTHVLPQTPGQAHMQADIDSRYEMFKAGDRDGDNHILKLMDQAGKNALHPRMLGMETDGKIKLEVWADHAAAWYHATKDTGFLDRDGNPHLVPGALRMVACELGVPDPARPNAWSVYSEMRSLLAARGVPADAIRFAQDADNDRKKAALWEDARTGRCNFVIGSAQTAGTGVDVPDRLQVLDYMTLSWNPTQFEQWLGRIVRQGNQNPEVAAHVWATEGTIEVLRADKIAMKSAPFEALLDGTSETRRLTEEDDNPISAWAAEMTARMSGNPLLTAQREAQLEVDVAQGMQNEWQRENGVKARRLAVMDKEIQELEAENAAIDDALSRAVDTKGDKFAARVGTGQYAVRAEVGAALIAALTATAAGDVSTLTGGNPQHLAELAGFPVTARYNRVTVIMPAPAEDGQETGQDAEPAERTLITLGLEGVPQGQVGVIDAGDLPGRDPAALITSLEDRLRRLPGHKAKNTAAIAENRDQITKTRAELAQPSPYLQQLAGARDALDRIEAQINEQIKDDTPAPDAAGTGPPPSGSETGQHPPGPAEPAPVPDSPPPVPGLPAPAAPGVQAGHAVSTTPATPVADEAADGDHPSSPDGAEKPDTGQASPGSGLTQEDLDFAYQHAYEYALGTSRDPGPEHEERALDYAAWYLAAYGGEESMEDLPDHRHAWARFADQGYPVREPARTASGQRDQDQPGTGATAETDVRPGHAAPEPPAAGSTIGLRELAAAHGLAAETVKTGGTLITTVHDGARTVLMHDDISGTRAGGRRLDPGEVPAYLAAYARRPQLPPRCLADLARHDPAEPAPLTLTAARETAARHGLEVRIRRVGGQSYITFCEPNTADTPILSYPAGSASAHHGPCPVPVTVIGSYLAAYRESVPAAMFTVPEPRDWGRRVAPLTPHLVDGSGHFIPAARDRLRAALAAARGDDIAEARRLLGEAEELTPVTLAPEREAELTAAVRRHTARYGHTEDPAAYLATASPPVLDASDRELGWVRTYIADHPEVREHPETGEPTAGPGSDREAAARIGQQAKEAFESGDYQRALALIDEAELRYPNPAIHWDAARDQVRAAISNAAPGNPQDRQPSQGQAPAAGDHEGAGTTAAAASAAADAPPAGPASGTDTEESAAVPTAAAPEPGTDSPSGDPDAERRHPGSTATEPAPDAPGGYYEARVADHPRESVTWAATTEGRASAEARARSHSARSDDLWEVRHVPGGPDAPAVIARYRLGFLQLDDTTTTTTVQPATGQAAAAESTPTPAPSRPPEGTQPLAGHAGWAGNLRPERLLYADGTLLTIRGQGKNNDQALPATAVGVIPAPADSDYGPGRLQVVRWDDGRYETAHPALASPRGTDPYDGLGDRDRARWQAFDYAEAWPTTTAGLLPHLVDPGDVVEVERGPRSHTVDLREVRSVERGTRPYADGLEFKIRRSKTTLFYPDNRLVPVRIPDAHPTLAAAIRAALPAGPGQPETASPAAGQAAADAPDTAASAAPAAGSPAEAPGPSEPDQPGRYSSRIRISLESGPPVVSGTSYDDPAELREALRANFTWRKKRQLWEYTGRSTGPLEAVAAVRDVLARLDRESAAPAVKEFPPTPQQQVILDAFLDGKDIAVQALAGTGKTTTLVLLARALMDRSPDVQVVYTAFNADIVADARRGRFGRNVTAMTMHSIAKQALLQTGYADKVNGGDQGARWPEQWASVLEIPDITAPGNDTVPAEEIARLVIATVRKFRESADDEPARQHLSGHLSAAAGSPLARAVLSYARKAWADIAAPGNAALLAVGRALRVDHDDYLKVWALSRPRINAGVIFFDEAQDVNAVMRRVILDQPAQTIVVGDSHQSIYGFRGAIDALKDWPADIVLPLTQSWRFGPDAAEFGNLFLRSLGSGLLLEGNPALATRLGRADEPDAILCRTNAAAVAEVFAGLESGKRVALAGGGQAIREIAKAARDLQAGRGTKHPDLSRFADWDEVRHYAQHEEDGKSLQVFVRLVDRHGPDGLIDMIGRLTPESDTKNPPQLTISTAHKAKGRQWAVVRIAGDFRGPVTDPETGEVTWPSPEERRLAYVAATRAQTLMEIGSLTWIYDHPQASTPGQDAGRQHAAQIAKPPAACPVPQPGPALRPAEPKAAAADAATQPQPSGAGETPAPGTAPAAPQPGPAASAPPATRSQPQTVPEAATADETDTHPGHEEPVGNGPAEPEASPLTNSDLAAELRRLPDFARWLSQAGAPPAAGDLDSQRPGAGSSAVCDERGIEITVSGPGFTRHGLVTWPQAASWIDKGVTSARLGLVIIADRLSTFCRVHRDQLIAASTCDPDATAAELGQIRDSAVAMIVDAALRSRGAAVPVPPARPDDPAWYTAVMITRPDRGAGKAENAALERLTRLRTLIREPQQATAAEIRATLRRWIGYGLADAVRALDDPAAMRAWISSQASRPVPGGYDNSGERWYGTSPDGLITDRNGDDRAPSCIRWEDIPAWIQPGITSSLRDRLLSAADTRHKLLGRKLTAAMHPHARDADVGEQEVENSARLLHEAIAAAWAAIENASPPAPAELDYARRTYRDTGPVQATLFDTHESARPQDNARAPAGAPQAPSLRPAPAGTGHASHHEHATATAIERSAPPEPARQHDTPIPAPAGRPRPQRAAARAAQPQPGRTSTPLTGDDIFLGLSRLPAFVFADLFAAIDTGQPLDSVSRQLAARSGTRSATEPDAGARETVTPEPAGVRIQVTTPDSTRAGLLTWAEVAGRVQPGLTPARRQIIVQASRTALRFAAAGASFQAIGESSLAASTERELRSLTAAAVSAMLDAARTGTRRRGSQPSRPADDETAALERIAELAAALPAQPPRPRTPVSQVTAGDIIGHPGYRLQPFRVSAPPRHHDTQVEITGHLTEPSGDEPAGEITITLSADRQPDPVVSVIPVPARSLRTQLTSTGTQEGTGQRRTPGHGTAAVPDAQPAARAGHGEPSRPSRHQQASVPETTTPISSPATDITDSGLAPASGTTGASQPAAEAPSQEEIMAEEPAATSPAGGPQLPAAAPAAAPAPPPAAGEAPRQPGSSGGRRPADPLPRPGDGSDLMGELDRVLDAIIERKRAAARQENAPGDFADIRAAFTLLRNALGQPAAGSPGAGSRPRLAAPGPYRAEPGPSVPSAASNGLAASNGHAAGDGSFDDIRAAFAGLRHVLDLPPHGRHARGSATQDPAASRLLDQAAAEAQACARWYRDTPEWQRITRIGRAARELIRAIREAAGDYWAEIGQDIRVRGFARTLAARVSLAVSGTAHVLATRLERAGHRNTRIWRAARGLHRATATFADRIMNYTPPRSPGRMDDVRRIISDLGVRQRDPAHSADSAGNGASRQPAGAPSPVTLARTSFPVPVSRATTVPPAEPARPAAASPGRHRSPACRP